MRALLRDAHARREARVFVAEGPRLLEAALGHDAPIDAVFVAVDAAPDVRALGDAARERGAEVHLLAPGVAGRAGDAVTSQGVFALVRAGQPPLGSLLGRLLDADGFVVVADRVNDPGNAGTLWRSAAASGAAGIVLGAGSVDAYNPKLVRATAGACFSTPVVDAVDIDDVLRACAERGVRTIGAVVRDGEPLDTVDLTGPCALVLGHEVQGIAASRAPALDVRVTIPMAAATESLNLAMAGTVLCFEAARQRRAKGTR